MTRTAFVTGAAGFLGRHLVEQLVAEDWQVVAFCRPEDPAHLLPPQVQVRLGNLTQPASVSAALPAETATVFHLAGNTSTWRAGAQQQWRDNVDGTRNLLNAMREAPDSRLIATASTSAFGRHSGVPINERTPSVVERHGDSYGRSKHAAELLINAEVRRHALDAVILYPANILGSYDVNGWARQLIEPIADRRLRVIPPGAGTWASVRDIAQAHVTAASIPEPAPRYVLGGVHATFLELVQEIQIQLDQPVANAPTPAAVMVALTVAAGVQGLILRREPALTIPRLHRALGDLIVDDRLAVADLGLQHRPLADQVADSIGWLQDTGRLRGASVAGR